jgi:hypothetical protein
MNFYPVVALHLAMISTFEDFILGWLQIGLSLASALKDIVL